MEKEAGIVKYEMKICLPLYKITYSVSFIVILSLIRGVVHTEEIGIAIVPYASLLAVVFCAETYVMERSGSRWEIWTLYSQRKKTGVVLRRLLIQFVYLSFLSYLGYFLFYWQHPYCPYEGRAAYLYGTYVIVVTVMIIFWGTLSMTIANLCHSQWAAMGISLVIWLVFNSGFGDRTFGKFNLFSYVFRVIDGPVNLEWLWGTGVALLLVIVMMAALPWIIRKRG